jgi:hypothetical protein
MTIDLPLHDRHLQIEADTTTADVVEFLESRLQEPARVDDAVVYNFHNRDLDMEAVENSLVFQGTYIVPYQVSGVWGFMQDVLPEEVATADLLTYQSGEPCYVAETNHYATEEATKEVIRGTLRGRMEVPDADDH